jgi:hypothetical protein
MESEPRFPTIGSFRKQTSERPRDEVQEVTYTIYLKSSLNRPFRKISSKHPRSKGCSKQAHTNSNHKHPTPLF